MATEFADMAQEVEHVLGKDEVTSSNLVISSKKTAAHAAVLFFFKILSVLRLNGQKVIISDNPNNTYYLTPYNPILINFSPL